MEFDNSFEVPLRPAQAWPLLMDIRRIAPCMPGAEVTEVIDETTYKGRIALYEVMPMSQELRDAILKAAPTAELREIAQAQGMKTLRQAGLQKVIEGTTTVDEVLRVTMS